MEGESLKVPVAGEPMVAIVGGTPELPLDLEGLILKDLQTLQIEKIPGRDVEEDSYSSEDDEEVENDTFVSSVIADIEYADDANDEVTVDTQQQTLSDFPKAHSNYEAYKGECICDKGWCMNVLR